LSGGASPAGIDAVGFKAVHGGPRYRGSFVVDDDLLAAMQEFVPVAPIHNPVYIQAMQIFREVLPGVPMVAVFEPGYHLTIPDHAAVYGIPYEWTEKHGVRRYGFHGSSHRYISERVPQMLGRSAQGLRLVSCHLGGSSSICAIQDGRSVDSSFGFSAQSGMEHAARSGELDPFAVLYLMEKENLNAEKMRGVLGKKSGLLGISGVSTDLRDIEEAARRRHPGLRGEKVSRLVRCGDGRARCRCLRRRHRRERRLAARGGLPRHGVPRTQTRRGKESPARHKRPHCIRARFPGFRSRGLHQRGDRRRARNRSRADVVEAPRTELVQVYRA